MTIRTRPVALIAALGIFCAWPLAAADKGDKPPKLFSENGEMTVTLTGPWRTVKRNVEDDVLYPAKLTYTGHDGQQHSIDVEVAPRGISRRLRVCDFPPLKVYFDKDKTKGTEFRGNKSLKLVTYCDTHSKYEQYYLKEFLAYRIYNLISEYSFRVRPLYIEYQDSERSGSLSRFGFLIEDLDDVAERNGLEKLSIPKIPHTQLEAVTTSELTLFQYMIGNVDWAATDGPEEEECCHNTKLIGAGNDEVPKYSIPYDFDSTGLVDAHYAAPPDALRLRNIKQRMYRGFCSTNETLPQAVQKFKDKKPEIYALFNDNTRLNDKTRKTALRYLDEFYAVINDPKEFSKEITGRCRG
jgi:hypothetical protein